MNLDDKARRLILDAWEHFWRHCGDPSAYYEDYLRDEELDEVMTHAQHIIAGTGEELGEQSGSLCPSGLDPLRAVHSRS